jgi:hypothetical protein
MHTIHSLPVIAGKNNKFPARFSGLRPVFFDIFKIKFIEMGKPAVPAPNNKVPAADGQVVGTGHMAVPASGCFNEFPEIITADFNILSFLTDILDTGDEDPCCPAVIAGYLCLKGHGRDNLVGIFFAVIAVRAVAREDEPVAHGR